MKRKNNFGSKLAIIVTLTAMLSLGVAAANNASYEFEAFSGSIDGSGALTQDSTNLQGYSAAVYDFESDSFETPESFYTQKSTTGSNVTFNFNISDSEKRHYGVYFYKEDSNGDDEYITYEYTVSVNQTGNNIDGFNSTDWHTDIVFAKKESAESNITLEQFDELVAGDPVDVGVNITVDSPLDHTDYTDYVPDSSLGGPNLTQFYETDVSYTLETYNLTGEKDDLLSDKTESETVSIKFGEYKTLDYTTISETGYYNITGTSDPTVDPKIKSGSTDSDFEEVQYLSRIKTNISSASNEYVQDKVTVLANLKDNLPANEADIAESIEYAWLDRLNRGQSLIDDVRGEKGLDAVPLADRTNYTVEDSGDLPVTLQQPANGDWYLCLRAWVNDTRSFIAKGETSCRHFMVDNQEPVYESIQSPTGSLTYSEYGYYFNTTVSDNIQLEEVSLSVNRNIKHSQTSFDNPSGSNDISKKLKLGAGSHSYAWSISDKVMTETGIGAKTSSGSVTVDPLAPQLSLQIENKTTGNAVNEVHWNDTVELNASTQTMYAPLDFSTNFTGWTPVTDKEGRYSEEINLDSLGTFNFEATAGENNENYTKETVSQTIDVKEIPTDANITLLNEEGQEVTSAGLMEKITVKADPQAVKRNSKAPINLTSNLTLSAWDDVNSNGVYKQEIQMKQEGTFQFNLTTGETGTNNEGFTNTTDSATLTVSTSNRGSEDLNWNRTITDQEIKKSENFNYTLEANYSGTASDLTWNVLDNDFKITPGTNNLNATVENATTLSTGEYRVPVEVYDSSGNYLSGEFNLTVNPDLYWDNEPSNTQITEGERYSEDFTSNVEYIGDKSNLTWNMTQNKNLFTAQDGEISDTQELGAGTYTVAFNVSDDEGRKINTSYELNVQSSSSGGGGDGGGSSGGSDDSGGSSLGGGGVSSPPDSPQNSIEDKIRLSGDSSELNLDTSTGDEHGVSFEVDEETNITTSVSGNASSVVSLPQNFTAQSGNNTIPLTVDRSVSGNYRGTVTLMWNGESIEIPLNLDIPEESDSSQDFTVAMLSKDELTTSNKIGYSVKIWDEKTPETPTEVKIKTKVENSEGVVVHRNNKTVKIIDVVVRDYQTGQLEPGSYTLTTTVTHNGQEYSGFKNVELGSSNSITGRFNAATSIQGWIQRMVDSVTSLF